MEFASRQVFGIRLSKATASTAVIGVATESNATCVVTCNGVEFTINTGDFVAVGADAPAPGKSRACYVGHVALTGLNAFPAKNTYSVAQGANTLSVDDKGVPLWFRASPAINDDFSVFGYGCHARVDHAGYFTHTRTYIEGETAPYCSDVFGIDDVILYGDTANVDDSAGTGHVHQSSNPTSEYDMALVYMAWMSMLEDTAEASFAVAQGREKDFVWVTQHVVMRFQQGDHEYADDLGVPTYGVSCLTYPSPRWASVGVPSGMAACWDKFIDPLNDYTIRNRDTASRHWAVTIGCATFFAPDGYSVSDAATVRYGNNQILDILDGINNDSAFKIELSGDSARKLDPAGANRANGNAQQPLFDTWLSEYKTLYTRVGQTPKSIMDNPKTNGLQGVYLRWHVADMHRPQSTYHFAPAYNDGVNDHAEECFCELGAGTVNGSGNFAIAAAAHEALNPDTPVTYAKCRLDYDPGPTWTFLGDPSRWHGTRADFYGSRGWKEMYVYLFDESNTVVHTRHLLERSSNEPFPNDWVLPKITTPISNKGRKRT
jgi:hypothetical protein